MDVLERHVFGVIMRSFKNFEKKKFAEKNGVSAVKWVIKNKIINFLEYSDILALSFLFYRFINNMSLECREIFSKNQKV